MFSLYHYHLAHSHGHDIKRALTNPIFLTIAGFVTENRMDFSRNFFSLLLLVVLATLAVDGQIKGVTIMFRHGERTPSVLYPKYNVTKISQDLGAGQLTLVSKLITIVKTLIY